MRRQKLTSGDSSQTNMLRRILVTFSKSSDSIIISQVFFSATFMLISFGGIKSQRDFNILSEVLNELLALSFSEDYFPPGFQKLCSCDAKMNWSKKSSLYSLLIFWGISVLLCTGAAPICNHTNSAKSFPFSTSSAALVVVDFLMIAILSGVKWYLLVVFNLLFSDD